MERTKNLLIVCAKYALGIVAIAYVFHKVNFSSLDFSPILQPHILALLISARLTGYMFVSLRWKLILDEVAVPIPFIHVFRYNIIAVTLSYLLLGALSADVGKAFMLGKQQSGDYKKIMVSIFLDRVVGLSALLALLGLGFALSWSLDPEKLAAISQTVDFKLLGILLVGFGAVFLFLLFYICMDSHIQL